MKPLKITIENINSFTEKQTLDFDFDGLFCISGDTGSGKTTILDCVIIALYGTSKRTGKLDNYINTGAQKATVEFEFEAESEGVRSRFRVTRTLRRGGQSGATLVNLDTGERLAEQTKNVNAAIYDIIRLGIEDFTQVVILQQGRFARFLSARKAERNETVARLFRLDRYKDIAFGFGNKKTAFDLDLSSVNGRLSLLEGVTKTAITDKERTIRTLVKRKEELIKQSETLAAEVAALSELKRRFEAAVAAGKELTSEVAKRDELSAAFEDISAKVEEKKKELAGLNTLRATLESKADKEKVYLDLIRSKEEKKALVEELRGEYSRVADEKKRAEAAKAECAEKARNLRSTFDSAYNDIISVVDIGANLPENGGYCDIFDIKRKADDLASGYIAASTEVRESEKKTAELTEKYEAAAKAHLANVTLLNEAKSRYVSVLNEVEELGREYEKERRLEAAAHIRSGLKEGDICPVCGSVVGKFSVENVGLPSEKALEEKKALLEEAERRKNGFDREVSASAERENSASKELSAAKDRLSAAKDRLSALTGVKAPDRIADIAGLTDNATRAYHALTKAEGELELKTRQVTECEKKLEGLLERGKVARTELDRLEETLKASEITEEDIRLNAERLDEAKKNIENVGTCLTQLEKTRNETSLALGAASERVKTLEKDAEDKPAFSQSDLDSKLALSQSTDKEREEVIASMASLSREVEKDKADLVVKRELEAQKADLVVKRDLYDDLFRLTKGNQYVEYIAEEYILRFTEAASVILGEITSGKYSLVYEDGEFFVTDFLAGGVKRSAETLSGGETFLASLSLAIAISREIAFYKSYEFFFLDEGFGTLDSGSLDTVMNALGALSTETMVGVVTHRSELTERIFNKIVVLAADESHGSLIVRQD